MNRPRIGGFKSIRGIKDANGWLPITPDKHNDWIGQRDGSFSEFISLGDKKDKEAVTVFENYSRGIATSRDAWCYNFSRNVLINNMQSMIPFYNIEVSRYKEACADLSKDQYPEINHFINTDPTKISWNRGLKNDLGRFVGHSYQETALVTGLYRSFTKSHIYFSKHMNDMVYQMPRIFPDATVDNQVICVSGIGARSGFSTLISNTLPDLQNIDNGQCFPLKLHEKNSAQDGSCKVDDKHNDMFEENTQSNELTKNDAEYTIKDGITNAGLKHFQLAYPPQAITKEDVFYYIYGLLHSEDYRKRYADNLSKELPRIPCVKRANDFWAFSKAGRDLAELHINYESVTPYPVNFAGGELFMGDFCDADYRVDQMKFGKKNKETDKTTVIYNYKITMTSIPLEAYEYVVNGKPALEWVIERQAVTTHKESGIVNDANNWAIETMNDAAYPLKLFQRVITVSLETMKTCRTCQGWKLCNELAQTLRMNIIQGTPQRFIVRANENPAQNLANDV